MNTKNEGIRVSFITMAVNIFLSVLKLIAGIVAHSGAMISDAVHSASDVLSTIIVIVGLKISEKESDHGHQYGHERLECIAAILLSVVLFATGVGIGYSALLKIIGGNYDKLVEPGLIALIAAVISIVVKEWMYHYTKRTAKKLNSSALMADAWHHRSDGFSSIGSFIGIFGARMGIKVLDPIAGFIICLFIIKASFDIFKQAVDQIVDKACDSVTVDKIKETINAIDGVESIDLLKTRMFGSKIYVDVEISADADMTLRDAHTIAENVHDSIEQNIENVKHCMVHVNPNEN